MHLGRRTWDRRAHTWASHGSVALRPVVDAVLRAAGTLDGAVAVDLGCGTGQLSLPMARSGAEVTAVDLSPRMIERLAATARAEGLGGLRTEVAAIEQVTFAPSSVDVVVSNYALHHLRDRDKEAVVRAAADWLRPGGRLVVGDMMFGRGSTARDRQIIAAKVGVLVRRGPAGIWRLVKNVARFTFRFKERPIAAHIWVRYFGDAGLSEVAVTPVVAEAAIVVGVKR